TKPIAPLVALSKTSVAVIDAGGTVRAFEETAGTPQWTGAPGATADAPLAATNARVFAVSGSTLTVFRAGGCSAPTCSPTWTAALGAAGHQRVVTARCAASAAVSTNVLSFSIDGCGAATCPALTTKTVTNTVTAPPTPLG